MISAPAGIICGATCSASYASGTAVTLTATPATGSTFAGWSGGGCTGTGTCTVTVTAADDGHRHIRPRIPVLTVSQGGNRQRHGHQSPAGITCGATCSAATRGTAVTLTAAGRAPRSPAGAAAVYGHRLLHGDPDAATTVTGLHAVRCAHGQQGGDGQRHGHQRARRYQLRGDLLGELPGAPR